MVLWIMFFLEQCRNGKTANREITFGVVSNSVLELFEDKCHRLYKSSIEVLN